MYVVVVGEEGVEGVLVGGVVGVDAIAMARTAEKQTRTAKNFMLIGFFGLLGLLAGCCLSTDELLNSECVFRWSRPHYLYPYFDCGSRSIPCNVCTNGSFTVCYIACFPPPMFTDQLIVKCIQCLIPFHFPKNKSFSGWECQ